MNKMTRLVGQKRRPTRTLLRSIRSARRLSTFIAFIISFAFLSPAALGQGHEQSEKHDATADFVVICTNDGFTQIAIEDELEKRAGSHCACPSSCTVSCCFSNIALRGSFIGQIGRVNLRRHLFAPLITTRWSNGPVAETKTIRAPPSF